MENTTIRKMVKEKIKGQYKTLILMALVMQLVAVLSNFLIKTPNNLVINSFKDFVVYQFKDNSIGILVRFFQSIFEIGILYSCLQYIRGQKENIEFMDIFHGFKNIPRTILVVLLKELIVLVGTFLFFIPGLIWYYMFYFVLFIIFDYEELSIIDIFKKSKKINNRKTDLFCMGLYYMFLPIILISVVVFVLNLFRMDINSKSFMGFLSQILLATPFLFFMPKLYMANTYIYDSANDVEKYMENREVVVENTDVVEPQVVIDVDHTIKTQDISKNVSENLETHIDENEESTDSIN